MDVFELFVCAPSDALRLTWVRILGEVLVELVGGFSAYEGTGGWKSESGDVVFEAHTRMSAHCNGMSAREVLNLMAGTIRLYKDNCHQEVVLVHLNGEPMFLEEVPEAIPLG